MNFKEILELIDKVAERGIGGVEIEQAGTKLRIDGKPAQQHVFASYIGAGEPARTEPQPLPSIPVHALPPAGPAGKAEEKKVEAVDPNLHVLTSPIVGTFYRSPNPESRAFVEVGASVKKGQVLCIVEAMKLMNEIESDVDGTVTKIFPQNGQPIEYGEPLFGISV